jgi:hypothetical protein
MDNAISGLRKMRSRIILIGIVLQGLALKGLTQTTTPGAAQKNAPAQTTSAVSSQTGGSDDRHANIGFVYPVSTNGTEAKQYTNHFSFNVILGLSASESGFTLAGVTNVIFDSASGFQIAGFSNHIYNRANGVQMAGFLNYTKNLSSGTQVAGFMNYTGSNDGVNIAGFGNISRRNSNGVQVAGFINKASDAGTQVAGFTNIANGNSKTQVGGFLNKSGDAVTQVAGFMNIAKKVKGVQIAGLINIADSSEYPVAIFNFIKNGEKTIGLSTNESLTTLVSFRSGSRKLYGIAGIGYNHKGKRELAAWEAGIGAHFFASDKFRLNLEEVASGLTDFKNGDCLIHTFRVLPAYHLTSRIELYAGPDFNYFYSKKGQGVDVIDHFIWSEVKGAQVKGLYFGVTGGIQVRL